VKYSGPVKLPTVKDENMLMVNMCLSSLVQATASGGNGTYNPVFTVGDVTTATDWAGYKALYQEFRVVGLMLKFVPMLENTFAQPLASTTGVLFQGVTQETNVSPLFMCKSHSAAVSTALTTLDQACNHFDSKMSSVTRSLSCSIKMVETDEAQWFSTNSGTTGSFGIKTYLQFLSSLNATATVNFGTMYEYFAVQFRGRVVSTLSSRAPTDEKVVKKSLADWKSPVMSWAEPDESDLVVVPRSAVKDGMQPAKIAASKVTSYAGAVAAAAK